MRQLSHSARLFWYACLLWSSEYMSRSSQYATENMYMCGHVTNLIFSVSFLTTQLLKSKLENKILQKYVRYSTDNFLNWFTNKICSNIFY